MLIHTQRYQLFMGLLALLLFWLSDHAAYCQKKASADTLYSAYIKYGFGEIKETYQALNPDDYDLGRFQLLKLGKRIRDHGNREDALKVFLMDTEFFPNSSLPFFDYGELAYELSNRTTAIAAYHQGLENLKKNENLSDFEQFYYSALGEWGLKKVENLNLTEKPDFTYYAYHGGSLAGSWDTENILKFKLAQNLSDIHYKNFDIYTVPVPKTVERIFHDANKPDVCGIFNGWVYRKHIDSGEIVAVDSLWDEQDWDNLFPESIRRAASHNGKTYLVPQAFQFNPVYYRKNVFDSLGVSPPKTWDDLLDLCDVIHQAGLIPFTISAKGWPPPVARWFTILNLRVNGFEFHRRLMNGEEMWTTEKVKTVFNYWEELFDHHAFAESSEKNSWNKGSAEFYSGKAVMYNIGEWIFENQEKDKIINDIDFFTIPVIKDGVERAEIFHLYGTLLLKQGEKKQSAWEYLKFAASKESQADNHKTLETRTPSNVEVYNQLTPLQKKQYDYIREVDHLVPLFEVNSESEFAEFALQKFLEFWEDQNNTDKILIELEKKRQLVFQGTN